MARRLLAADIDLTVWNRTPSRSAQLASEGARLAESPTHLAADSSVVITMLADANAVIAVLVDGGVLDALPPGAVVIDMSTIGPRAAQHLSNQAAARKVEFLDAPVSGSVSSAENGELLTLVGGDKDVLAAVRPILAAMTRDQAYLGTSGAGAAMKLALNIVIGLTNQAACECLALAEQYGVDREAAYAVLETSAVGSPFLHYKRSAYLEPERTEPAFTVELMQKDLDLAVALGREANVPLPATAVAAEVLTIARRLGHGARDMTRVLDALRARAAR